MPNIDWSSLPERVKVHLIERLREPNITIEHLESLRDWIGKNPQVPEGDWYKDSDHSSWLDVVSIRRRSLRKEWPLKAGNPTRVLRMRLESAVGIGGAPGLISARPCNLRAEPLANGLPQTQNVGLGVHVIDGFRSKVT